MAKRILTSATPEEISPDIYNPLIDSTHEDTVIKVNSVLEFLSMSIIHLEVEDEGTCTIYQPWGLSLILDTCRAALTHSSTMEKEANHA